MEPCANTQGEDMNVATTSTRTQVRDPICGTDVDPATYPKSSMALELAVPTYTARQVHYTCPIHPRDRAGGASNQIGRNVVASKTEITFTSLAAFAEQRAGARLALRKRTTGRDQHGNTERRST